MFCDSDSSSDSSSDAAESVYSRIRANDPSVTEVELKEDFAPTFDAFCENSTAKSFTLML
jgi:hypothetical protein